MNLDAGHIVPQVEISDERSGVERAGVDHFARAEDAQFDVRLAFREIGQARHQPACGEHRRRRDQQLAWARSRIVSPSAASDSKPSRSFGRQARAASVSCTPRPARRNSSTPRYSSRLLTWWLTAAWVIDSSFAASLKERWRAAASNTRSAFSGGRR